MIVLVDRGVWWFCRPALLQGFLQQLAPLQLLPGLRTPPCSAAMALFIDFFAASFLDILDSCPLHYHLPEGLRLISPVGFPVRKVWRLFLQNTQTSQCIFWLLGFNFRYDYHEINDQCNTWRTTNTVRVLTSPFFQLAVYIQQQLMKHEPWKQILVGWFSEVIGWPFGNPMNS